ncbi:hypothetical protein NEMBOFW57_006386 [Staphylotrichum longicolle]|uniref:Cytochrome P450 n=1 Tax=Staphylotrichum longicolle TaxID=669026 RepID=A0AAD4EYU7_9PEZI|nr:hypothetical protein NEMBOFW57_006386 [Staphylotrichum longicolle]
MTNNDGSGVGHSRVEGTATALSGATFLLLRHPDVHRQVVKEVRDAFVAETDMTAANMAGKLPFLDAVLNESMRLYPPVAITLPRRVPEGGEILDGRFVPAGYTVGVNHLACYRSELNFEDPDAFRPNAGSSTARPRRANLRKRYRTMSAIHRRRFRF